jgi:hypothetical protein
MARLPNVLVSLNSGQTLELKFDLRQTPRPAGDFSIAAEPRGMETVPGGAAESLIQVQSFFGDVVTIDLLIVGLDDRTETMLLPPRLELRPGEAKSSRLRIEVKPNLIPGTYPFQLVGLS